MEPKIPDVNNPDFSKLPAHVITHILGYLRFNDFKTASSICKSWFYASNDPQITKTYAIQIRNPNSEVFQNISKINRRYGSLKLMFCDLNRMNSNYFEIIEKFCPFLQKLEIYGSDIQIHPLLKLLQHTIRLEHLSLKSCNELAQLPNLLPLDYDYETKNRIIKNLGGVKKIELGQYMDVPCFNIIVDLVRFATNLESLSLSIMTFNLPLKQNYRPGHALFYVDDLIKLFIKLNNLNLKSFTINIPWYWEDDVYKSSLFCEFILKIGSLEEFHIDGDLLQDQLSLICQNLVNLKKLYCQLGKNVERISELGNLQKLENLNCRFNRGNPTYLDEINKFFKCKFEHLRIFQLTGLVTESNLLHFCQNHQNLIDLSIYGLATDDLEPIFKYLIKLRKLYITFDKQHRQRNCPRPLSEYKISRLQDLEVLNLSNAVRGITKDDVKQLNKLRTTNFSEIICSGRVDLNIPFADEVI